MDDFWPAVHESEVHATPVMVDFDYDGVMDILLATNDGELLVIKDTVSPLSGLQCPGDAQPSRSPASAQLFCIPTWHTFSGHFDKLALHATAWRVHHNFNQLPHKF